MRPRRILEAQAEARRFLQRLEALKKTDGWAKASKENWSLDSSKESGAVRRASMDLTRALAEMRKY